MLWHLSWKDEIRLKGIFAAMRTQANNEAAKKQTTDVDGSKYGKDDTDEIQLDSDVSASTSDWTAVGRKLLPCQLGACLGSQHIRCAGD